MSTRNLRNSDTSGVKKTPKTRKRRKGGGMEQERPSKIIKTQPSQMRPFTRRDEEKMLSYLIRTNSIPNGMNIETWRPLELDGDLFPHRMGPIFMHFVMKMLPNYTTYKVPRKAFRQLQKLYLCRQGFPGRSRPPGGPPTPLPRVKAEPLSPEESRAPENRLETSPIAPVDGENSPNGGRNCPAAGERVPDAIEPLAELEKSIEDQTGDATPVASPGNIKPEPLTPATKSSDEVIPETPEELRKNLEREIVIPDLSKLTAIKREIFPSNSDDSLETQEESRPQSDASPLELRKPRPRRNCRYIASSSDDEESPGVPEDPESLPSSPAAGESSRDSPAAVDSSSSEGTPVLDEEPKARSSPLKKIPVAGASGSSSERDSLDSDSSPGVREPPEKNSTASEGTPSARPRRIRRQRREKSSSSGELKGNPRNGSSGNSESEGEEEDEDLGRNGSCRPGASPSRGRGRRRLGPVRTKSGVGSSEDEDEDDEPREKKSKGTKPTATARGNPGRLLGRHPNRRQVFTAAEDQAMVDALVKYNFISSATGLGAWQKLLKIGVDEIAHRSAKSLRNHFSNYVRWNYQRFTDDPEVREQFAEAERRRRNRHING